MVLTDSSVPNWLKNLAYAVTLSTAFEAIYYFTQLRIRKKNHDDQPNTCVDAIFFPDSTRACDAHFSYGCTNKNCWLAHEETSTMKLLDFIKSAQRSMDICVYCIASQELTDAVLKAHEDGALIRIVTDQAQAAEQPQQIARLRAAGIEVRTNDSSFFMHHKFMLVDNRRLMTGSFNWSRNAMLGNDENVLFISDKRIIEKYFYVFEKLWEKYVGIKQ